ncbi:hypothetical protein [Burkholderia multivorans]|uniref:hypothetical protein n=1 Tax=Burkholderia multivorans TaxID=87883 RepID=UPI0021BE3EA6|nr:hypothetical protein [Burkholderia multivorans]
MTLSRDGFLSTHINALADEALRDYCPGHAALVEQINRFAIGPADRAARHPTA